MKKLFAMLLIMTLCASCASATIFPPTGVDEDFKSWTGIECTPAVILCQTLSVLDNRGDQGGKKVETLRYSGQTIPVIESWDGYAKIYYADGSKTGWVRNDYLMMNPAWYVCDEDMQAFAYPDVMAPRVALLDKGTKLPILTEYDDGQSLSGWVCVSLRGAAGWIRKTPADTANQTWFRPEMLADLTYAQIEVKGDEPLGCTDPDTLEQLAELLTHAEDEGGEVSGCPFTATLFLETAQGKTITLQLATDSCCVYRVDGRDYAYARHLIVPGEDANPGNEVLFGLFGVNPMGEWMGE